MTKEQFTKKLYKKMIMQELRNELHLITNMFIPKGKLDIYTLIKMIFAEAKSRGMEI